MSNITHIAILVCNKFAAVLLCKLATSLTRQDRKFTTRLPQINANDEVGTRRKEVRFKVVTSDTALFQLPLVSQHRNHQDCSTCHNTRPISVSGVEEISRLTAICTSLSLGKCCSARNLLRCCHWEQDQDSRRDGSTLPSFPEPLRQLLCAQSRMRASIVAMQHNTSSTYSPPPVLTAISSNT
ncbi:hypothetical protein AVEN_119756-1 [Araneus ventricosus]|uniref:Uncharacterized protein n=1 Tax=Araneus ventricosus TaxID=182803 RepID=A0A4Y2FFG5_ARAVE|nr:hypothetical protein AVEN_119756-1 [Araneus ventricosus]